ncbi:MAG TPA: hypothetical protein P5550_09100 [Bacteroidales bacterium]|nr:hypothetical protein [Bacteroidales bacterium]HRZ77928.1 hypothetical protein [Bacteroidales bacterium]
MNRKIILGGLILFTGMLLSSCATTSYPTPASANQSKHMKKSLKKYGKENPKNLRIKSNYRIKG